MYRYLLPLIACCYFNLSACQSLKSFVPSGEDWNLIMAQPQEDAQASGQSEMAAPQDNNDDDSPMVHVTPNDYASWARGYRKELESQGEEAVLMSELPQLIECRREDESPAEYAQRYTETMNEMIQRGVSILNDQTTHDVAPNRFHIAGRDFDVGPESGITKKEYREFSELLGDSDLDYADIPERFKRFEVVKPHSEV